MRVLIDTNIILDLLLDRAPFSEPASQLISKIERSEISGYLCATTVTTIHYLLSKHLDKKQSTRAIKSLMTLFEIAPVNRVVIENGIASSFDDFEDAVLDAAAKYAGAQAIITRNIRDFKHATVPVYTPAEFLAVLSMQT